MSSVISSLSATDAWARLTLRMQQLSVTGAERNPKVLLASCLPVEGGHGADGQQQVEQTLGGVGQAVVLPQQVAQSGEVLARQHVHHHHVPHGEARQEAVAVQPQHPKAAGNTCSSGSSRLRRGRGLTRGGDV